MTRFIIGLLLGLLIGIGGTAAFLITANGGDYLIVASPRVRELEASLKNVDQDRQWLRSRLNESNDTLAKLESRFSALAARFDSMSSGATHDGAIATPEASPSPTPEDVPTPTLGDPSNEGAARRSSAPVARSDEPHAPR
jgi:hypothetical protein